MAHSCFARTAQRLDAEYDGGNSDSEGDDSDDEGDDTPMKLDTTTTRKIKLCAKLGKKGKEVKDDACKRQKTGRASSRKRKGGTDEFFPQEKPAEETKEKEKEKKSDEDSVDEEIARLTANVATKRKPDETQRAISALIEQTRQTQRGLLYAASADVSACDETQAEEEGVNRSMSRMEVVESASEMHEEKKTWCIITILREGEKKKKFKMNMNDQMSKVFDAFATKQQLAVSSLRFVFDGLAVSRHATPQDLDIEAGKISQIGCYSA